MLVEMTNKLGVRSDNNLDAHSIDTVIKCLKHTRKILYEESKKNKEMSQPKDIDLFTQVTDYG
jgi:hypothetical protein